MFRYYPAMTYKVGLDISAEMIDTAKSNYPDMNFRVGDIRDFKFDMPLI